LQYSHKFIKDPAGAMCHSKLKRRSHPLAKKNKKFISNFFLNFLSVLCVPLGHTSFRHLSQYFLNLQAKVNHHVQSLKLVLTSLVILKIQEKIFESHKNDLPF
jgi:hypothetical protein